MSFFTPSACGSMSKYRGVCRVTVLYLREMVGLNRQADLLDDHVFCSASLEVAPSEECLFCWTLVSLIL